MAGHLRQNAGPAGAEGLPREAEWRATGSRMAGNWEQNCWQPGAEDWFRKVKSAQLWGLRAFTICFAAWATLRKGTTLRKGAILPCAGMWPTACANCLCRPPVPTCNLPVQTACANLLAGRRAGRGGRRLVELVLDEELDGLVFCHSEFVVEDCGVVVSLLCAEPEFSLV